MGGKQMTEILINRHDILIIFDVTNGNPNGDPDAGNMPRIDPNTNKGIITDVCLKRKIRNYVEIFKQGQPSFDILVHQGAVLNDKIAEAEDATKGQGKDASLSKGSKEEEKARIGSGWLCNKYFDVRTFGAVLATGNWKGSAHGQIRGPAQFTFAQSYHPINPLEFTITRCAVTKEEDRGKERSMGRKHVIPYALYSAKCFVSPAFAERTGFSGQDLEVLFEALGNLFTHDRSAARGDMVVRGIYDFEHVGTQHPNNHNQNLSEARLGCYHAHKLFEGIEVTLQEDKEFPESFSDYRIDCKWTSDNLPPGVKLQVRH
jgi:CRISPR-associated protein Csd2